MSSPQPASTRGKARADRNARAILDSAVAILGNEGWGGFAFTRVAAGCGLSERPVRDRFPARLDLARAVWVEAAGPSLMTGLGVVITAVASANRSTSLGDALAPFVRPGIALRAARELLLVARFEGELHDTVTAAFSRQLDEWVVPRRNRLSRTQAAANAYALAVALGLLLHADRPTVATLDLAEAVGELASALHTPAEPQRLPHWRSPHLDGEISFGTGDPALDSLLRAAVDEVGERGFEAATVASIARASGYSEGALFNRYPTKRDLVVDATSRMLARASLANAEEQARIASSHSVALAQAVLIREMMMPSRHRLRSITLEQIRLAIHEKSVMEALEQAVEGALGHSTGGTHDGRVTAADVHLGVATGVGVLVLADLQPDAWMLPYDAVTVALNEDS